MLLLFKIQGLLRSKCHSLCITLGSLIIVLCIQPVVPSEISPCKIHLRIHLDALTPLSCGCILLLVVEQTTEIVVWLVAFREIFLGLFKHRNGLKTERVAVIHRHRQGSLIHGLVAIQITEPHLDCRICLLCINLSEDLHRLILESVMQIKKSKLYVILNLPSHKTNIRRSAVYLVQFICRIDVKRINCKDAFKKGLSLFGTSLCTQD